VKVNLSHRIYRVSDRQLSIVGAGGNASIATDPYVCFEPARSRRAIVIVAPNRRGHTARSARRRKVVGTAKRSRHHVARGLNGGTP